MDLPNNKRNLVHRLSTLDNRKQKAVEKEEKINLKKKSRNVLKRISVEEEKKKKGIFGVADDPKIAESSRK